MKKYKNKERNFFSLWSIYKNFFFFFLLHLKEFNPSRFYFTGIPSSYFFFFFIYTWCYASDAKTNLFKTLGYSLHAIILKETWSIMRLIRYFLWVWTSVLLFLCLDYTIFLFIFLIEEKKNLVSKRGSLYTLRFKGKIQYFNENQCKKNSYNFVQFLFCIMCMC